MTELQCWTNGDDHVVAHSIEDIPDAYCVTIGEVYDCFDACEWRLEPMDRMLEITEEDRTVVGHKTVGEWIAEKGRGLLCSVNY